MHKAGAEHEHPGLRRTFLLRSRNSLHSVPASAAQLSLPEFLPLRHPSILRKEFLLVHVGLERCEAQLNSGLETIGGSRQFGVRTM